MSSYNKVILMGNLTRDPELRYTPKGTAVAKLGLATTRTWYDANKQKQEETTFIDVDAFGKQAEVVGQYLSKGRPLMLEGRLKFDQWEDKSTGQKRSKLGVVLESFQFINDGKGQSPDQASRASSPGNVSKIDPEDVPGNALPVDESVPF